MCLTVYHICSVNYCEYAKLDKTMNPGNGRRDLVECQISKAHFEAESKRKVVTDAVTGFTCPLDREETRVDLTCPLAHHNKK
jgi:hypothetical protein